MCNVLPNCKHDAALLVLGVLLDNPPTIWKAMRQTNPFPNASYMFHANAVGFFALPFAV